MQMMLQSGKAYSRESLRADIVATFGPEARFFTCSAENLTPEGLRINIFDRALGMVMGKPSRFIEDLPAEQLRPVTLIEDATPWDDELS